MEKECIVTDENHDGLDEIYANFFTCPDCKKNGIIMADAYCRYCGVRLIWETEKKYSRF